MCCGCRCVTVCNVHSNENKCYFKTGTFTCSCIQIILNINKIHKIMTKINVPLNNHIPDWKKICTVIWGRKNKTCTVNMLSVCFSFHSLCIKSSVIFSSLWMPELHSVYQISIFQHAQMHPGKPSSQPS